MDCLLLDLIRAAGHAVAESMSAIDNAPRRAWLVVDHYGIDARWLSANRRLADRQLVIDDLASTDPWHVRGVEIRGPAEARRDVDPPRPGMSRELITIHPKRIRSWGLSEP